MLVVWSEILFLEVSPQGNLFHWKHPSASECWHSWIWVLQSSMRWWRIIGFVQLLWHVQFFATPRTQARQAHLTFTVSRSLLKFMSIQLVTLWRMSGMFLNMSRLSTRTWTLNSSLRLVNTPTHQLLCSSATPHGTDWAPSFKPALTFHSLTLLSIRNLTIFCTAESSV